MLKAIIFDLDGVILDSEPIHFEAHKKAMKIVGINLTREDYMNFGVAKGDYNLYTKASQKYGVKIDLEKISKLKKEFYKELINKNPAAIDGVKNVIENLYGKYVLAIASSGIKNVVDFILRKLDIGKYFAIVVSGDDVEKVKPAPDIYLRAVDLLKVNKKECLAIEDSESGLIAAKEAGIKCVVVPCEFTKNQNFSKADMVLEKLSDLNPENV